LPECLRIRLLQLKTDLATDLNHSRLNQLSTAILVLGETFQPVRPFMRPL
jgi:hypothetical protein